jgi:hypothetical protein
MPKPIPKASTRIKLTDLDFSEIAAAGGIKLKKTQRRHLLNLMKHYEFFHRSFQRTDSDRAHLRALLRHLDGEIGALRGLAQNADRFHLMFTLAGCELDSEIATRLKLKAEVARDLLPAAKRDPGHYRRLPQLLFGLETIFKNAGGGSTKINRPREGDRTRRSPFIDFAWEVILRIPEPKIFDSHQALAVAWEEIQPQWREGVMRWSEHYRKSRKKKTAGPHKPAAGT